MEKNHFPSSKTNVMAADCCLSFLKSPERWIGHLKTSNLLPITGFHEYAVRNWTYHVETCRDVGASEQLLQIGDFLEGQAYTEWIQICEDYILRGRWDATSKLEQLLRHLRSDPPNPLFASCYLGIEGTFKQQFNSGAFNIRCTNEYGETLLFVACMQGHELIVELLLDWGVDADVGRNPFTANPLMAAVEKGSLKAVQLLLERGANYDANGGLHPDLLTAVVVAGTPEMVELVLDRYGGEITESVVELAASKSRCGDKMVDHFWEKDGRAVIPHKVAIAALRNESCGHRIIELLIAKDSALEITEGQLLRISFRTELATLPFLLRRVENFQVTEAVLRRVAQWGHPDVMESILAKASNVAITEEVFLAANGSRMLKFLLCWGGSMTVTEAVLLEAVEHTRYSYLGCETVLNFIQTRGRQTKITETLFVQATQSWDSKCLISLLQIGTNIEPTEAVMAAAAQHGKGVLELLLTRGTNISITKTIVAAAAGCKRGAGSIELLLRQRGKAEIDERVIVAAAMNENKEVFEFLLGKAGSLRVTEAVLVAAVSVKAENVVIPEFLSLDRQC